jgi:hypothetical protein
MIDNIGEDERLGSVCCADRERARRGRQVFGQVVRSR